MKKKIGESEFIDTLRADEYVKWSYGAAKALYEYFEQYEDDTGEDIELDPVAIRCEFSEYTTCDEAASNYFEYEGMEYDEDGAELLTADELEDKARAFLEDRTTVLEAKTPATGAGHKLGDYITSYVISEF